MHLYLNKFTSVDEYTHAYMYRLQLVHKPYFDIPN